LPQETEWNSRAALLALLDVATVLSRADIKSELIKESDRYALALGRMAGNPGVDRVRLEQILQDIRAIGDSLQRVNGQLGHALRNNEFLTAILQRSSIPGGSFDFDLPQFHYWLQLPHPERTMQLDSWRHEVAPVQEAVDLLLSLIRSSSVPQRERAEAGFFQRSVAADSHAQLVRVTLARSAGLYAEVSGGKHRFSVRFLESQDLEHPSQTTRDVDFLLTTCSL
jgi:cell division protein ZapD